VVSLREPLRVPAGGGVMIVAGKLPIKLSGSLQNPAFSPDGSKLSFTRFRDAYNSGRSDIGFLDLSTGETHVIAMGGEANVSQPGSCWTDRGIIFSSDAFGPDRACLWDGSKVSVLFHDMEAQTWEPSQCAEFYVAERHNHGGGGKGQIIRSTFADLKTIEPITSPSEDCRQPCLSRDGTQMVYQRKDADWTLILRDLASGRERDVVSGTDATFSYDGKRLVFSDADGRLAVIELATGIEKHVATVTPYSGAPSFAPGDQFVAYEGGPDSDDGGRPSAIYIARAP
jgi:TolB protein